MGHRWNPVAPVIVVADDDPAMRTFVSHVLTIDRCRLQRPNSDGRSGLDMLQFIRATPNLKDIPVIVLTGFPLNQAVVQQVEALHAELWHKPVDPSDLVQRLNQLVYHHHAG